MAPELYASIKYMRRGKETSSTLGRFNFIPEYLYSVGKIDAVTPMSQDDLVYLYCETRLCIKRKQITSIQYEIA